MNVKKEKGLMEMVVRCLLVYYRCQTEVAATNIKCNLRLCGLPPILQRLPKTSHKLNPFNLQFFHYLFILLIKHPPLFQSIQKFIFILKMFSNLHTKITCYFLFLFSFLIFLFEVLLEQF